MPPAAPQVMLAIPARRQVLRRGSGFTLLELMVTLVVASVLVAIAVPSFNQMIVTNRLTAQANDMVSAINFARSEAVMRNARIRFCRANGPTATACVGSTGNWTHWIVVPTLGGNVVRRGVVNTASGGLVVQSTLPSDLVEFGPEGLARTSAGALISNQRVSVCAPQAQQGRRVILGRGSRLSTETFTGSCGP